MNVFCMPNTMGWGRFDASVSAVIYEQILGGVSNKFVSMIFLVLWFLEGLSSIIIGNQMVEIFLSEK
jgi:hypothetical protein